MTDFNLDAVESVVYLSVFNLESGAPERQHRMTPGVLHQGVVKVLLLCRCCACDFHQNPCISSESSNYSEATWQSSGLSRSVEGFLGNQAICFGWKNWRSFELRSSSAARKTCLVALENRTCHKLGQTLSKMIHSSSLFWLETPWLCRATNWHLLPQPSTIDPGSSANQICSDRLGPFSPSQRSQEVVALLWRLKALRSLCDWNLEPRREALSIQKTMAEGCLVWVFWQVFWQVFWHLEFPNQCQVWLVGPFPCVSEGLWSGDQLQTSHGSTETHGDPSGICAIVTIPGTSDERIERESLKNHLGKLGKKCWVSIINVFQRLMNLGFSIINVFNHQSSIWVSIIWGKKRCAQSHQPFDRLRLRTQHASSLRLWKTNLAKLDDDLKGRVRMHLKNCWPRNLQLLLVLRDFRRKTWLQSIWIDHALGLKPQDK